MISYCRSPSNTRDAWKYAKGFEVLHTDSLPLIGHFITTYVWSPIVWTDGVRKQSNFKCADWVGLDFDSGLSLSEATDNIFADSICIIGTTKSHQKWKGEEPPCDRFRVVLKLTDTITKLEDYIATTTHLVRHYGADEAAKDGARLFYPCTNIEMILNSGYTTDIIRGFKRKPKIVNNCVVGRGKYLGWLKELIEDGKLPQHAVSKDGKPSRNITIYKATIKMLSGGLAVDEIEKVLWNAPFSKNDFSEAEFRKAVRSASSWFFDHISLGVNVGRTE